MGGRIQNYVFKLTNRATVDEMTLTKETVCNIQNDGTKTFVSTEFQKGDGADAEDEEEDDDILGDIEVIEADPDDASAKRKDRMKHAKTQGFDAQLEDDIKEAGIEEEVKELKTRLIPKNMSVPPDMKSDPLVEEVLEGDNRFDTEKIYRKNKRKNEKLDIDENDIKLKASGNMNDVFIPMKCSKEEIDSVLFIQSAVPRIKVFLLYNREYKKYKEMLNLPFCIGI